LRMLERPEEIRVSFPVVPDGPPKFFHWRQCRHDVVRAEGPERIALEWWKENPHRRLVPAAAQEKEPPRPIRDYFRIETREGLRFWLYRDGQHRQTGLAPRWFMQGIFA